MGFPPIYEDVFENEGEGPLVRHDILPDIELTGDTTGKASCGEDGQWTVETSTPVTVELVGDITGTGSMEDNVVTVQTSASAASKLANACTIKLVGDVVGETQFDGSGDVEIDTTGLFANMSVTTDRLKDPINVTLDGDVSGTAEFDGSDDLVIHTTVTGSTNAELAEAAAKLETARTITFTGDTTGEFEFDGTENKEVELSTDAANRLREAQYINITGIVSGRSAAPFDGTDEVTIYTSYTSGNGPMVPAEDELTQKYSYTWYTADTNGYVVCYWGYMQSCYLTVHNITHYLYSGYDETGVVYIPVAAGQEYFFYQEDSYDTYPRLYWLPAH